MHVFDRLFDRPGRHLRWIAIAVLLASALLASACSFGSPVVATVGGSPITKHWLDSVVSAFEGDAALQRLVDIVQPVTASTVGQITDQPGLSGSELRVELLYRRLNLEVVDTMLGRMGLDPTEWRNQVSDLILQRLANQRWKSDSQRETVIDFVTKWRGDRQLLIEALMPSNPDEQSLRTLFDAYPGFGAKLCFSVIKVQGPQEAQQVEERLRKGESFSQVAADLSQDLATKPRRGDVGCVLLMEAFEKLQDPAPFAVALSLSPGQARGPIQGPSGGLWYVRHNEQGSTGFDFDSARPQLIEQYQPARSQFVSDRFAEVAQSLDVRVACPEGRWNPELMVIESCDTSTESPAPSISEPQPVR